MGLFSKTVTLEVQLQALAEIGLVPNEGVTESDLTMFEDRAQLERRPYRGLVEVMGAELEREPYTPISDRLWMCDHERVEDHGAYREVLMRLEVMTENALGLGGVVDYVDLEQEIAWVEFGFQSARLRWELSVQDDWLDPSIFGRYDRLLEEAGASRRLYSNRTDYGQVELVGAFTLDEKRRFDRLTKIKMLPIGSPK